MGDTALRTGVPRCDNTRVRAIIADAWRSGAVGVHVGIGAHSFFEFGEYLGQPQNRRMPSVATMNAERAAVVLQAVARGRATRWRLRSPIVRAAARAGLWPPRRNGSRRRSSETLASIGKRGCHVGRARQAINRGRAGRYGA